MGLSVVPPDTKPEDMLDESEGDALTARNGVYKWQFIPTQVARYLGGPIKDVMDGHFNLLNLKCKWCRGTKIGMKLDYWSALQSHDRVDY